jgi:lysophospholipase L1-like esterase
VRARTVIATLGDSYSAGRPLWDPDPSVRARLARVDETSQYQYWAARENANLEFRNHGISGQRTDEIAQRLGDAAGGADVLLVQGGINDVVQGRSVETAAENLRALVRAAKARRLQVILADVLPWNNGWPDAEEPIRGLNALIHELAAEQNVAVLPFYATLEDAERPGRMRADWTDDGNHPSVEGYRRLGLLLAPVLARLGIAA